MSTTVSKNITQISYTSQDGSTLYQFTIVPDSVLINGTVTSTTDLALQRDITSTLSSAKSYTDTKTSDMLTKTVASSTYQPKGDYITKDKFTLDGTVLTIDLD